MILHSVTYYRIFLLICIAPIIPALMSCDMTKDPGPAPVALFGIENGSTFPDVVYLTNQSENATEYHWDFGDGNTSHEEHPEHTYSDNGTYKITLTATGNGQEHVYSKTIEIFVPKYFLARKTWQLTSGSGSAETYTPQYGVTVQKFDQTGFYKDTKLIEFISSEKLKLGGIATYIYNIWSDENATPYIHMYMEGNLRSSMYFLINIDKVNQRFTLTWDQKMLIKTFQESGCLECVAGPGANIQYTFNRK